jgi:hypothetical protein
MTKRNIILIIAVVVAILLAIYIAYRGFFAGNSAETGLLNVPSGEVAPVAPILSQGTTLDFGPIKKYNSQEQLFNYPKTSPDEVSLPLPDLIK